MKIHSLILLLLCAGICLSASQRKQSLDELASSIYQGAIIGSLRLTTPDIDKVMTRIDATIEQGRGMSVEQQRELFKKIIMQVKGFPGNKKAKDAIIEGLEVRIASLEKVEPKPEPTGKKEPKKPEPGAKKQPEIQQKLLKFKAAIDVIEKGILEKNDELLAKEKEFAESPKALEKGNFSALKEQIADLLERLELVLVHSLSK